MRSYRLLPLIKENLSIILTFGLSRGPLHTMRSENFLGEWKYLDKLLFEVPQDLAERACIELAAYVRLLDDDEKLAELLRREKDPLVFGRVLKIGGPEEPLYLRDLTNKIAHASGFDWDFTAAEDPKLICQSDQPERWVHAEVRLVALADFCGRLMS
jgi:hypothetical protein